METAHPEASLYRTLHKARGYLTVAALLLILAVALVHMAGDAMLFAVGVEGEMLLEVELQLRKILYIHAAVIGPIALGMLLAGAFLVRARFWTFILIVAILNLALQGVITYAVVDKWNEIAELQRLPHHSPHKKQLLDWHYFQFGVMALTNGVGYYAGLLTLVTLGRENVRGLFWTRKHAPASW